MSHLIQNSRQENSFKKKYSNKLITYSQKNHKTWAYLYNTQVINLKGVAHSKMLGYIEELSLPRDHVPSLEEVSKKLYQKTGWQVCQVEELIDGNTFFELLSNRMFSSTIYIRNNEGATLSRDPDIFHESRRPS